ncbi:MAG: hypothetical protein EZS28_022787 [Streblomastix strix]|uniref:Uncharacterized protein n=1 Tax=Streblomastix strix TaxID=222440 RepID=A0A5J4VGG6_9EUKA|nr:MAG: hypothetical protein EZS28_022787 [Streblomastix strix]
MSASIQQENFDYKQEIKSVQNPLSQETPPNVDFEEMRLLAHILQTDNELMQAQHIRRLIELICDVVRQGFCDEIIDFVNNERLLELLQMHVSHKHKELRTIRDVLMHIVDVIPHYEPSENSEKESIEMQQANKLEEYSSQYNEKNRRNSTSTKKPPKVSNYKSPQNNQSSMKAKKISSTLSDSLIDPTSPESDHEKEQQINTYHLLMQMMLHLLNKI